MEPAWCKMKRGMQRWTGLAGTGLAALTALAHGIIGTWDTLLPLLRADLPPMVAATFHACWHFVTLFLVTSTVVFARRGRQSRLLAWLWVGFGGCFLLTGAIAGSLMLAPQWIVLIPTGVLILWSRQTQGTGVAAKGS